MEIKTIYTKVKDYIEYKKFVFEDLRAMGYISKGRYFSFLYLSCSW